MSSNDIRNPHYVLHKDVFTDVLRDNIEQHTKLHISEWLDDWWVHEEDNPMLTWEQLIDLALHILYCEATRLFMSNLYLKEIPTYTIQQGQTLTRTSVSGSKRVNAYRGEWEEYNFLTQSFDGRRNSGDLFRLSGKDDSCCVEGTWRDWCCFACNVLAHENTKIVCPDLYEPSLENSNY